MGAVTRTLTSDSTHSAAILTAASGAIAEEDSGQPRQLLRLHFILGWMHNLLEGRQEVLAHMRSILAICPPIGVHRAEAVFHPMQGKAKREDAGLGPVDDSRYGTAYLVEE